ncbi:MAG: Ryanodine receptor Ryr [Clostridia bacterium]|nr:Ryanodine receptor Ryr [Clostridia bacterium]
MYKPEPLDLSGVQLPEGLNELMEKIAENVHENWAYQRAKEGWTYGEKRDDSAKTTPCMVAYDELSDEEKAYDRITAEQTLKTIIALGYSIEKK